MVSVCLAHFSGVDGYIIIPVKLNIFSQFLHCIVCLSTVGKPQLLKISAANRFFSSTCYWVSKGDMNIWPWCKLASYVYNIIRSVMSLNVNVTPLADKCFVPFEYFPNIDELLEKNISLS